MTQARRASASKAALLIALLSLAGGAAFSTPVAIIRSAPPRPLSDAQFCAFARQVGRTVGGTSKVGANAMRIEAITTDCARRRMVWITRSAAPLQAPQLATIRNGWSKAMCADWPFADAIRRGWTVVKEVKANARAYSFAAACPSR